MKQKLFEWLMNQSPMFIVLAIINYVQWNKVNDLETKVDNCQGQQIELLKTTVEKNTDAFRAFTEELKEIRQ